MPANTEWTGKLSKISLQLAAGKKLTNSGKANGRDLTDKDREQLEAEKAKWLQVKANAKDAEHDERMKNINSHTTQVGADVQEHVTNELARQTQQLKEAMASLANPRKRTKQEQKKAYNPFKGGTVT